LKKRLQVLVSNFTFEDIILGLSAVRDTNYENELIDTLLIILKREVILQRENKYVLNTNQIELLIKKQWILEKSFLSNKQFKKRWSKYVDEE
jgi:hypothetical protein